jgi:hypothetical protein
MVVALAKILREESRALSFVRHETFGVPLRLKWLRSDRSGVNWAPSGFLNNVVSALSHLYLSVDDLHVDVLRLTRGSNALGQPYSAEQPVEPVPTCAPPLFNTLTT